MQHGAQIDNVWSPKFIGNASAYFYLKSQKSKLTKPLDKNREMLRCSKYDVKIKSKANGVLEGAE